MIKKLKKWLQKPGNSRAKLAFLLEIKSSSNIDYWIKEESVPKWHHEKLKAIFEA